LAIEIGVVSSTPPDGVKRSATTPSVLPQTTSVCETPLAIAGEEGNF